MCIISWNRSTTWPGVAALLRRIVRNLGSRPSSLWGISSLLCLFPCNMAIPSIPMARRLNWIPVLCIKIHQGWKHEQIKELGQSLPIYEGMDFSLTQTSGFLPIFFSLSDSQGHMFPSQKHHGRFWRDVSRAGCVLVVIISGKWQALQKLPGSRLFNFPDLEQSS